MKTRSRRYETNIKKIEKNSYLNLEEAIKTLKKTATAKFIENTELHVSLNLALKGRNESLRTMVTLPHTLNQSLKIAVLTDAANFELAKTSGASIIGDDDLIQKISNGYLDFNVLLATPSIMFKLVKLSRFLSSKGLMPSLKSGTIINPDKLADTIFEFKQGKFEYKADKTGIIHVSFGKSNFSESQLLENLRILYSSIEKNRPLGIKGKYFKSLHICTTMGPSLKLDLNAFI